MAQVGASQIVVGSDYPYPWEMAPVDHIFASTSLSDEEKADILGRTAAKLFGMTASHALRPLALLCAAAPFW